MLMDLLSDLLKLIILILVMIIPSFACYQMIYKNELYIKFNEKWKQGKAKLIFLWISIFISFYLLNFSFWETQDKLTNQEINIFLQLLRAFLISIINLEFVFMFYIFLIVIFIEKEGIKLKRLKKINEVKNEKEN